jgi:ADP-ribosylglycohydrolase
MRDAVWTPHGEVFDIGNATREAILRLESGVEPTEAGLKGESHCGNGSLMRILPVGLFLAFAAREERAEVAAKCSRLTHGHPRCQLACVMFTEMVASLVRGKTFEKVCADGRDLLRERLDSQFREESAAFERLLSPTLPALNEVEVSSSGYVIHCLEASIWCTQRADTFRDGVLAAVNLGEDTDTTGAVAGALLGLCCGVNSIPSDWIESLARLRDVRGLIERFEGACLERWRGSRCSN